VLLQFYLQQPVAKRNSQQGKAKSNKPVIHMTLSLKEDVQLRETENAWKPGRMKPTSAGEQDAKTEVCIWHSLAQGFWKQ
jgi:translation initiation factor 4G